MTHEISIPKKLASDDGTTRHPRATIDFAGISAVFNDVALFSDVNFTVEPETLLWLQGPNGSGKTTLLRLAAGLIRPEKGQMRWTLNHKPATAKEIVTYHSHAIGLKKSLLWPEELAFWAKIYDFHGDIDALVGSVGLTASPRTRCGDLSAGQKRRVSLLRLFMSNRPVWLLDEPTTAMDTDGQNLIKDSVTLHIKRGGSVVLASHRPPKKWTDRTKTIRLGPSQ